MIKRLLIANRAEIALRIIRACRRLGIESVAVHSPVDADLPFVKSADRAIRFPASEPKSSYLDGKRIVEIARASGCDAIHPGYGFLSENAEFARLVASSGIIFIGPSPEVIAALGDKLRAKELARHANVPCIPGFEPGPALTPAEVVRELKAFGTCNHYPILLKAAAGGGGRGMRIVSAEGELQSAFEGASREAEAYFRDARIYAEKLVSPARHIEVQIAGDRSGEVIALGDRDCSLQRHHQKVIEEAPASLPPDVRTALHTAARNLAKGAGYTNLGTVEFLVDARDNFYFLEVNSRLQVEHPITELVTGADLVELQLELASGAPLASCKGLNRKAPWQAAVELRICAESPEENFTPATGVLRDFAVPLSEGSPTSPEGHEVRLDAGYAAGSAISHYYDSLIGKIVIGASSRAEALRVAVDTLDRANIFGVKSNCSYLRRLLNSNELRGGTQTITTAEAYASSDAAAKDAAFSAGLYLASSYLAVARHTTSSTAGAFASPWMRHDGFRVFGPRILTRTFGIFGQSIPVSAELLSDDEVLVSFFGQRTRIRLLPSDARDFRYSVDGVTKVASFLADADHVWARTHLGTFSLLENIRASRNDLTAGQKAESVRSPLPGKIVSLLVKKDDTVEAGATVAVLESMKMEHPIRVPHRCRVSEVAVAAGTIVDAGSLILKVGFS